jgi:N-acylneuraminate cytidylyltransferase/CMP-N,N'-diacetyllegionaminic acid synthase
MYQRKKVLAIIPARGGSKRLPRKNILDLNGKPLIAWTIDAALKSKYIDKTIVSTDDKEIADISTKYGAEVPFIRPAHLSTDTASSIDVVFHAVEFLKKNNEQYDIVILLQPTSPLRTTKDINKALEMLNNKTKAVISVCETDHPPLWSNTLPEDHSMKDFIRPEIKNKRSQDLPKFYRLNGAIYISEVNYLKINNGFLGEQTKAFIMPRERSIDIDSLLDFILVKEVIKHGIDLKAYL